MRHIFICANLSLATCLSPINTYAAAASAADVVPAADVFQSHECTWQQLAFGAMNEMSGNSTDGALSEEALGELPRAALQLKDQPLAEIRAQLFDNPYLASIFVDMYRDVQVTWDLRTQLPIHERLDVLYELMEKWERLRETIEDILCSFYKKAFEGADTFAPLIGEGLPNFNASEAKTNILAHLKDLEQKGHKIASKLYAELLLDRMNKRHDIMVALRGIVDGLNSKDIPETDEDNGEHEAALLKAREEYTRAEVLYFDTRTLLFEDIAKYPERQGIILAGDDAFRKLFAADPAEIYESLLGEGWDPYTLAVARISFAIHGTQAIVIKYFEAGAGSVDSPETKFARDLLSRELNQFVGEDPTRQRANATLQMNALVGGGADHALGYLTREGRVRMLTILLGTLNEYGGKSQIPEIVATLQVREAIASLQMYEMAGEVDPALLAKATRFTPRNENAGVGRQAALEKIIKFAAQGHGIAQTFMLTRLKGHESINQLSQTLAMVRAFKRMAQGG